MKPESPYRIARREQVHFRYWHSEAYRYALERESIAALPPRERVNARVTARSYVASKLEIAARNTREAALETRDDDRWLSMTIAMQCIEEARRMRATWKDGEALP